MPLFSPILRRLDEHVRHARRTRLSRRLSHVIAQDRVDRLAATTGWQPPRGVSAGNPPPPGAADVVPRGGRDAPR